MRCCLYFKQQLRIIVNSNTNTTLTDLSMQMNISSLRYLVTSMLLLAFISLVPTMAKAQAPADKVLGTYWGPDKDGKVQLYKQGDKYFGKIVWVKAPRKDTKNPDASKRNREVLGLVIFENFKYDGDGEWNDGTIYDTKTGKTYDCKLWLEEGGKVMMARGFIGISLLGRTARFERID